MPQFEIKASDYSYTENDTCNFWGIKFRGDSPYTGVIVVYGTVSIKEDPENNNATLSFNYNIQDAAQFNIDELESSEDFKNYLGDVLTHIVSNEMNQQELETNGHIESTADSCTESSSQQ